MRTITIRSNSNVHRLYTVVLNDRERAIRCDCQAGSFGRPCCHLERAELAAKFLNARTTLERQGMSREVFNAKFRATVRASGRHNRAVNDAIKRTIAYAQRREQKLTGRAS